MTLLSIRKIAMRINETTGTVFIKIMTGEKKAFIVLRKDYTLGNENYGNMSQIQGTVTIDLNGFTMHLNPIGEPEITIPVGE